MLVLEIALGLVLGVLILRALPQLIGAALGLAMWALLLLVAAIALAALIGVGAFVYWKWERILVLVGVLACYIIGGMALRAVEVRSRYTIDELFIMALCLATMPLFGALLGYSSLAAALLHRWEDAAVAGFAAAVALIAGIILRAFMRRGQRRAPGWNAPLPNDAKVISGEIVQ